MGNYGGYGGPPSGYGQPSQQQPQQYAQQQGQGYPYPAQSACATCGLPISPAAPQCPRCGHPNQLAPQHQVAASTNYALRTIAAFCTLAVVGGLAWGVYAYVLSPETKDDVNHVASVTGVSVVSWPERARTAATAMYQRQGPGIAQSILNTIHPTGNGPQLSNYSASVEGDDLVSRFDVRWTGGVLGTGYVTTVEWRCRQTSSGEARIVSDTAMIHVAATNAKELELYFARDVYPALKVNAN